jgi:hypothetical protein
MGRRHVLVPITPDEDGLEDYGSAGVRITTRNLVDAGVTRRFIDVACEFEHLREVFSSLADEVLDALRSKPDTPAQTCSSVLDRWRELLGSPRLRLLGAEQLAGLFAELRFLGRLAADQPVTALSLWTGPRGGRFDFLAGTSGLEIKASMRTEGRSVEIHGDRQLEAPEGGDLHLLFLGLERVTDGGESVPDLVEPLLIQLDREELFTTLLDAGYNHADAEAYRQVRFTVLEELLYYVDDAFPKIIPSSFVNRSTPVGVTHLRYRVDLGGERPIPLPADRLAILASTMSGERQ